MNNYILEYYQKIQDGSITVGAWIKKVYEALIKGLENKAFFYNQKKANLAIKFIENYCRHCEGPLAPQLLKLELWEKALIASIFGIVDEDGNRHFREVFVVVGRKNGKTLLMSAIAECCTFIDGEYGGRIYFASTKLEQAALCFDAYCQTIYKDPRLSALAKKRRTDVYIEESNTVAKPLAYSSKKSDGLNISLGICDEISAWSGDQGLKFYEVLKSSQGARKQPLLISISTAGYVNDGPYDELFKRSTAYLNGDSREQRLLPFLYTIDHLEKWNDISELAKSNPNLGVSIPVDYLLEEIAIAEGSLSKKNEFVCKYCNIKQSSVQAWLDWELVHATAGDELRLEDFRGTYCVGGIDLSQTTDLTSCCVVIERHGVLNIISQSFIPANRIETLQAEDGVPYQILRQRGLVTVSGENYIDYHDVFTWFVNLVERYEILPLMVGYDRYSAQYLCAEMEAYGFHMTDVRQGYNLTPVIREFEGLLKDGKVRTGNNSLLQAHLLNTALKNDLEAQRVRIAKVTTNVHIDACAAALDAMTARQANWLELGSRLQNEGK